MMNDISLDGCHKSELQHSVATAISVGLSGPIQDFAWAHLLNTARGAGSCTPSVAGAPAHQAIQVTEAAISFSTSVI